MSYSEYTSSKQPVKYEDMKKKWDEQSDRIAYELKLIQSFQVADHYLTQRYLDFFSSGDIIPPKNEANDFTNIRIFEITKMVYDPSEQINDKFISVYSSLHNMGSSVALIIKSQEKVIHFYVATRSQDKDGKLSGETLCTTLKGNFPGIEISDSLTGADKHNLMADLFPTDVVPKSLATVSLIPSERDEDKDRFIQGIEKFLDSMNGNDFTSVLLAVPVRNDALAVRRRGYEELYSNLSPHARISMSFAHSKTDSVNVSISDSFSNSINNSVSNSEGTSSSTSSGSSRADSSNFGVSGNGYNMGFGSSDSSFSSYTSGSNFTKTVSTSTGKTETTGIVKGDSTAQGITDTTSLTFENKSVQNLMDRTKAQLDRIDTSECYGMWDFCAYFFSNDVSVTIQAANVYKALMMGQNSSVERAHVNIWGTGSNASIGKIIKYVQFLEHPIAKIPAIDQYAEQLVTPTNMVNGCELPIVLGFPRKSIPGMAVVEMAEFGRSVVYEADTHVNRSMEFGNIYHMGVKETMRVPMNVDLLSSHCFITGSSGSGKSYATYQLLDNLLRKDINMLVIEPAKGEYKQVFGGLKGIRIFTTDPNVYKLLRINPFQFPENLHILTHIEKLIQIFNASWSLTAAMPALLKDAVVQAYRKCGWDIMNSIWIEGISKRKYPVFQDVLDILPVLIDKSSYSAEAKGDYKGALLTRVKSMTNGIAGLIFERSLGIPDKVLFDSNAVVDLSDIGSEETIALLMGVIIMKLGEYRQSSRKAGTDKGRDLALQHVTVLEEAHNLLKRTSKEQSQESSNIVGKSVEMISNSIKEMRTYGEGFIIIDQSPMAVDSSAIENTSTKIIMNTPAKDACEELSSALALNDVQARELSRLPTGVAAVYQKGWLVPVLMKIDLWDNRYETEVHLADLDEIRSLRGHLAEELCKQSMCNSYSLLSFRRLIRDSNLDSDKKHDFDDIVGNIGILLRENPSGLSVTQRAQIYLEIIPCTGLIEVIDKPEILSANTLRENADKAAESINDTFIQEQWSYCAQWVGRFKNAFANYAYLSDNSVVEIIMKEILELYAGNQPQFNKYGTIFSYVSGKQNEFTETLKLGKKLNDNERAELKHVSLLMNVIAVQAKNGIDKDKLIEIIEGDAEITQLITNWLSRQNDIPKAADWGLLCIEVLGCREKMDQIIDSKLYSPKRLQQLEQKNPNWFNEGAKKRLKNRCAAWKNSFSAWLSDHTQVSKETVEQLLLYMVMARCNAGGDVHSPYTTIMKYLLGREE